jgi:hypothetical protein
MAKENYFEIVQAVQEALARRDKSRVATPEDKQKDIDAAKEKTKKPLVEHIKDAVKEVIDDGSVQKATPEEVQKDLQKGPVTQVPPSDDPETKKQWSRDYADGKLTDAEKETYHQKWGKPVFNAAGDDVSDTPRAKQWQKEQDAKRESQPEGEKFGDGFERMPTRSVTPEEADKIVAEEAARDQGPGFWDTVKKGAGVFSDMVSEQSKRISDAREAQGRELLQENMPYLDQPFPPDTGQRVERGVTPLVDPTLGTPVPGQPLPGLGTSPAPSGPGMLARPPEPPPTGGSTSVSAKVRTGGTAPTINDPSLGIYNKAASDQEMAGILDVQNKAKAAKEAAIIQQEAMDKSLEFQIRRDVATKAAAEVMENRQRGLQELQQQVLDAGNAKIDPGRYWANKDSGQKAMAVIAGALYGFTGQGMQWLQRLDGLVEQDIKAQQADLANKERSLGRAVGIQENLIQMAKEKGLSDVAAIDAAKNAMWARADQQLELMQKQAAASDPVIQQQILKMRGELGMKLAENTHKYFEDAKMDAHRSMQDAQGWAQIAIAQQKAAAKAAGGGKQGKLPPAEQGQLARARAGLKLLPELDKAIGSGKLGGAIYDQVTKMFPGTDASNREVQAAFLNRSIFAGIDRSVINNSDQKWLDEIQASPGLSALKKPGAMAALKRMLEATRNSIQETGSEMGQNVGEQTPEGDGIDFTEAE